jgi:hypothetical protein
MTTAEVPRHAERDDTIEGRDEVADDVRTARLEW